MRRLLVVGLAFALLTVGFVQAAIPQKLIGVWVDPTGSKMTIKKNGRVVFNLTGESPKTATVSVKGARITFGLLNTNLDGLLLQECLGPGEGKGLYSWKLAGRLLTLRSSNTMSSGASASRRDSRRG